MRKLTMLVAMMVVMLAMAVRWPSHRRWPRHSCLHGAISKPLVTPSVYRLCLAKDLETQVSGVR